MKYQISLNLWNKLLPYSKIFEKDKRIIVSDLTVHKMYLLLWTSVGFRMEAVYMFSASKAPVSCLENSFGTPLGLHYICEKIGHGVPINGEFVVRKFTGQIVPQAKCINERARIVSRILRLQGCELGKNKGFDVKAKRYCDTFKRCVYIHGTNLEKFIPQPLSHGCLLLKTEDLLDLFNRVRVGDFCWIG